MKNDISKLIAEKERLKNKITDNIISWQERMNLYQQIQLINKQINKDECKICLGKKGI
jgi:hypothetical protein